MRIGGEIGIDPFDPDELTDDLEKTLSVLAADLDAPVRDDFLDAAHPNTLGRDLEWLRQAASTAGAKRR